MSAKMSAPSTRRPGLALLHRRFGAAAVKTLAVSTALLALAACGIGPVLRGEDPQVIVDKRVVGMQIGDFFQRYGAVPVREEARDGTMQFNWEGGRARVPAGPRGPEESLCRLRIAVDKGGRIVAAPIMRDGQGEHRLSRCVELFDSGPPRASGA